MRSPARAAAGFTLIEALVATALFAMIMIGTMPLFIHSISAISRNRNLMHNNGGTQALIDELTTRYGINKADGLIFLDQGWKVYNNGGSQPTLSNAPIAVVQMFRGAANDPTDRVTQNNLLGQIQFRVFTDTGTAPSGGSGTDRIRVTVELYYFKRQQAITAISGSTTLTPATAVGKKLAVIRQESYIDQP